MIKIGDLIQERGKPVVRCTQILDDKDLVWWSLDGKSSACDSIIEFSKLERKEINFTAKEAIEIVLNENEKIIFLKYSEQNSFWNNLYNINFVNNETIVSNLGSLNLNHKLFRPRLFNEEYFVNSMPIDHTIQYHNFNDNNYDYININDYLNELQYKFNCITDNSLIHIYNIQTINEKGSINPVEKWLIEATWNLSQKKILFQEIIILLNIKIYINL